MHKLSRLAVVLGFASMLSGAALWTAASPAFAHHAILSGVDSCASGDHVVTWTITNSVPHRAMAIVSADATLNGVSYPVDGYTSPIDGADTTTATTTIPGAEAGTVTLVVDGHWNDGHSSTRHADVELLPPCGATSTTAPTSTSAPTSTVPAPTTTVSDATTTTSSTATTTPPPGGTPSGGTPPLASTGPAQLLGEVMVALGCLFLGCAMVAGSFTRRRSMS